MDKNPKTCILYIGAEVGKVCERVNQHADNGEQLISSLVSITMHLWNLSISLHLDLEECVRTKMLLNSKKYPVHLSKGCLDKYSTYSHITGITKTNQCVIDNTNLQMKRIPNIQKFICRIPILITDINQFTTEREWNQYDTSRNLVMALLGEVGELSEILQYHHEDQTGLTETLSMTTIDKLSQEIADVAIYTLRLVLHCQLVISFPKALLSIALKDVSAD